LHDGPVHVGKAPNTASLRNSGDVRSPSELKRAEANAREADPRFFAKIFLLYKAGISGKRREYAGNGDQKTSIQEPIQLQPDRSH
jgi:hypothetical protein